MTPKYSFLGNYSVNCGSKFRVTLPSTIMQNVIKANGDDFSPCGLVFADSRYLDPIIDNKIYRRMLLYPISLYYQILKGSDGPKTIRTSSTAFEANVDNSRRVLIPRQFRNQTFLGTDPQENQGPIELMVIGEINKIGLWKPLSYYNFIIRNNLEDTSK